MFTRLAAITIFLGGVGAYPAAADTIRLKSGAEFTGVVNEPEADPVWLKIPNGRISFNQDEIEEIVLDDIPVAASSGTSALDERSEDESLAAPVNGADPLDAERKARRLTAILMPRFHDMNSPEAQADKQAVIASIGALGSAAAPALESALQGERPGQTLALAALQKADPKRAEQFAREAVTDHPNCEVREESVKFLAARMKSGEEKRALLKKVLTDDLANVRAAALDQISQEDAKSLAPELIAALGDPLPEVAEAARKKLDNAFPELRGKNTADCRDWGTDKFGSIPQGVRVPPDTGEWTLD